MKLRPLARAGITALLFLVSPALLSAKPLEKKVEELESRIDQIQKTYLQNNQDAAAIAARSEEFQREAQALKGSLEGVRVANETAAKELQKQLRDIDVRLRTLEDRMGVLLLQTTAALKKISPELASETELYQKGLDALQSGNYIEATAAFQQFTKRFPKSKLNPLAAFWIAESAYGLRDYQRAIKSYQGFIKQYPQHDSIKGALLKQGMAFYELGLLDESKAFFQKVVKEYQGTLEATQATEKLAKIEQRKTNAPPALPTTPPATSSYPESTIQEEREQQKPLEF